MASFNSPPIKDTTTTSIVVALPELVELIGQHIKPSDLYTCARVCKIWNRELISLLWRTIDTRTQRWRRIMDEYYLNNHTKDETNEWIKTIFQKHGHHIRHLYVHWELVLEAASLSTRSTVTEGRRGGCRNLLSLSAVDVMSYILLPKIVLGPMDLQLPWLPEDRKEVLLSEEYLNRRHLAGCFWLLVRQNSGLVNLILSRNGLLEYLPDEYNLETLSQLTQLKELYIGRSAFDIQMLLGALPRLEQLQCHGLEEVSILQQNYDCLRYLNYRGSVHLPKLLNILRQLPGLEELRLTGVVNRTLKTASPVSEVVAASAPFPQLKEFRLDGPPLADDTLIALLVTLFPGLLKISMSKVPDATMKALWEHCFYLDSLHDFNKDDRISAWRERRAKDICS